MLKILLEKGKVLLVKGKGYVRCKGDAYLLGVNMDGRSISIRHGKILPIEAESNALVTLELDGGEYSIRDASEGIGTSMWRCIDKIFEHSRAFKVMLIGGTDAGKSTLSAYIANLALMRGLSTYLVDADIGQGDIAPPACMGSCMVNDYVFDLRDLKGSRYYFIGRLSPMGIEDYVIKGIKHLTSDVKSDICIVNTDGYIDGYGSVYKVRTVEEIKPDIVIVLGNFVQDISRVCKNVLHLHAAREVYKSKGDRIARRLEQYKRFISDSSVITFRVNSKRYEFMGKNIRIGNMSKEASTIDASSIQGMFVALNIDDTTVGFGIILSVDDNIKMMSSYEGEFDKILLSNIRLNNDMTAEHIIPL